MHILNAFLRLTKNSFHSFKSIRLCNKDQQCDNNDEDGRQRHGSAAAATGNNANEGSPLLQPTRQKQSPTSITSEFRGFEHSGDSLKVFAYHLTIYYGLAVLGYSVLFEKMNAIDSLYLASCIFTTIGYGDIGPTTPGGQIFTIVLGTYGIIILGIFLGVIGSSLVEFHELKVKERSRVMRETVKSNLFENSSSTTSATPLENGSHSVQQPPSSSTVGEADKSLLQSILDIVILEAPIVGVALVLGFGVGYFEGWTFVESIYWLTISGYTIGLGDFAPATPSMRLFCVFFLPFAVAVLGEFLTRIASAYMSRKQQKFEKEFLHRTMTLYDIKNLDLDNDGRVDLAEFLRYMLVAMQKVEKEDIDDIVDAFHRLDADGSGYLTAEDLTNVSGSLKRSVTKIITLRKMDPAFLRKLQAPLPQTQPNGSLV